MVYQGNPGRVRRTFTLYHTPLMTVPTGSELVLLTTILVRWTMWTTRWRGLSPTWCTLPHLRSKGIQRLMTYHRFHRESFGHPRKIRIFAQNVAERLPHGVITFFLERSKNPTVVRLRKNRDEARRVARTLIDQKQEALTVEDPRKDILSLLGSPQSPLSWNDADGVI